MRYIEKASELKQSSIAEVLKIACILKDAGVDLGKIKDSVYSGGKRSFTLLKEIKQEGIDINKIIEENGLDGNFKYGRRLQRMKNAYTGTEARPITGEEIELAKQLGLIEKDEKIIKIARILKAEGVELSIIPIQPKIDGKQHSIILKEIKQEGIDINEIIEKHGLDGNFKYGEKVKYLKRKYKDKNISELSEEERELIDILGLFKKDVSIDVKKQGDKENVKKRKRARRKNTVTGETLKIAKILKEEGIMFNQIQLQVSENGKIRFITLKEIKQEGIDINKIIEKHGLDGDFKYGEKVRYIRRIYRGQEDIKLEKEEKKAIIELGLLQKSLRSSKTKKSSENETQNQPKTKSSNTTVPKDNNSLRDKEVEKQKALQRKYHARKLYELYQKTMMKKGKQIDD